MYHSGIDIGLKRDTGGAQVELCNEAEPHKTVRITKIKQ